MMLGQVDVCMCAKSLQSCLTLQPIRLLCPWESPDNTGANCHALLQGIFLTQESNPHLMSPALTGRFFTTNITWEAWDQQTSTCKRIKSHLHFTPYSKINSQWIKYLHIITEAKNFSEEIKCVYDLRLSSGLLGRSPEAQSHKKNFF